MVAATHKQNIVQSLDDLPKFGKRETLCIDLETTTFRDKLPKEDKREAFDPWKGIRACGIAICKMDGSESWYIPIRHNSSVDDGYKNLNLKEVRKWFKKLLRSGRDVVNHNIKFDARVWHFDGCKVAGNLLDTMVLARIVDNTLPSYSLAYLTGAKGNAVAQYIKSIKSDDYGRAPISLMGEYAQNDVIITAKLYNDLKAKLTEHTKKVWKVEAELTRYTLDAEINGVKVAAKRLRMTYKEIVLEMIELEQRIHELVGIEFDPASDAELAKIMEGRLGLKPKSYTKTGKPQWNATNLKSCGHEAGPLLAEYRHLAHFSSTYCNGWLRRIDDNRRLHPNFKQSGTVTGRFSSSDPNLQNLPPEAEGFVLPDDGCVIIGFDYSQIEYRLFAHYANATDILKQYHDDIKTDFHKALADTLGIPRSMAKRLNFGFLYGMGKKRLLRQLRDGTVDVMLTIEKLSDRDDLSKKEQYELDAACETRNKLYNFLDDDRREALKYSLEKLTEDDMSTIASNIWREYHAKFPMINGLRKRVSSVIYARGEIRNWCGRTYTIDREKAYIGVNYLIQGSAADIFKQRLLAVLKAFPYAKLITNIHDSAYFSVPKERGKEFFVACKEVLLDVQTPEGVPALRVPLLVDGKVSAKTMGAAVACSGPDDYDRALEASKTKKVKHWRGYETEDFG